ncbi:MULTISPECIES: hypothetical protein [Cupriavidus]|uniref:Uncharacterized protein n=1 Tax=Cupriavidus taiwanensis TaxID=164546 RepID=A0A7Z7NR70_9BURK|nr:MULTISPECIES: hypothetical protein [Cupriavidus]NOV27808.1 hypothetical protein [Cupriavidus necator]NSX13335.1 hypothetical protein [Cupriavidus taiwanensis]SOZ18984.1 conserved hypothetical protein [Cupriavidus taiwanensis]SOZ97156.1 conserved hypothetical protein [Cupriavidus taiwanensis]SPC25819.1 conserved hypothetical protein [Cupriavidus taiwanensis]
MIIPLETAKAIYRRAIDPRASDHEGEAWWAAVADEVNMVVSAKDAASASAVISWWHHDWSQVADSPRAAAARIRRAARSKTG